MTRFRPSFPYFFSAVHQSGYGAGRRDGAIANHACIRNHIALRVLVHRLRRGQRRFFAEVDERGVAIVGAQQQKSPATEVAGNRMHNCQRESRGYGCVDGIAAFAQNLNARIRGEVMHADHHAVLRANRLLAAIREHVGRAFLRARVRRARFEGEGQARGKGDEEQGSDKWIA